MNTGIIERVWIYLAGCYLPMRTFDFCPRGSYPSDRSSVAESDFLMFSTIEISFRFRIVHLFHVYYSERVYRFIVIISNGKNDRNLNDAFSIFVDFIINVQDKVIL